MTLKFIIIETRRLLALIRYHTDRAAFYQGRFIAESATPTSANLAYGMLRAHYQRLAEYHFAQVYDLQADLTQFQARAEAEYVEPCSEAG